jgi:hypothetical protein
VSAESLFLHSRSADSDGQMGLLKAAQEPLRGSKCENDANLTGFCTMNPADNQFDLFDALGRNSQDSQQEAGAGGNSCLSLKLLIGKERRTGRELARTVEHPFPLFLNRSGQGFAHVKGGRCAPCSDGAADPLHNVGRCGLRLFVAFLDPPGAGASSAGHRAFLSSGSRVSGSSSHFRTASRSSCWSSTEASRGSMLLDLSSRSQDAVSENSPPRFISSDWASCTKARTGRLWPRWAGSPSGIRSCGSG